MATPVHKPEDVVILRDYPKPFADALLLKLAVYSAHRSKEVVLRGVLTKLIHESGDVLAGYHVIMYSGSSHKASSHVAARTKSTSNKKLVIIGVVVPLTLILILVLVYAVARCRRNSQSRRSFPANYCDQSYLALHADEDSDHELDDHLMQNSEQTDNPIA